MRDIYAPLDPGIADVVHLLRQNGINTFASCQGGPGHSFLWPTVRIEPTDPYNMKPDIDRIATILSEAGCVGYYLKQVYAYQAGPRPWAEPGQHFIEVEFWPSWVDEESRR